MLMDKISELEREKHKLLSELSSSHGESSPSSIDSSRSVTSTAHCTSNVPVSMSSIFVTTSSVNQIKQERLVSSLANNLQSDSVNSSGTNHVHSFDTSNGSMIDQTSVIVSVTSAASASSLSTLQNCIQREQTQNARSLHHISRLNDENKINCTHHVDDDDDKKNNNHDEKDADATVNDVDDDDNDKSPLIMHTSDNNSSPCRRNFTVTLNDKSQVNNDTPADSNNESFH